MFRRGCYNLLEVERTVPLPIERTFRVVLANNLNQGRCAVILPPQGLSAIMVWRSLEPFVYEEALRRNLKIVDFRTTAGETSEGAEPYVIPFSGRSIREDMLDFWNSVSELRSRYSKPVFTIVGFDTLEYIYGKAKTSC